jgi:GTP-binding protein Era
MENPFFKSGFIAVMGRPNVGKSTLVNALVGQKIAAVTPRPQTTRKRQMGILTLENAQVIFIDTPGFHQPHHKLGESMNLEALQTLDESDLVLFIGDLTSRPTQEDQMLAEVLQKTHSKLPSILVLNKCDLVDSDILQERTTLFSELIKASTTVIVSAIRGDGLPLLLDEILTRLHQGGLFFPEEQVTDLLEREIAADLVREAALIFLRDEVPHGIAVRVDQFQERQEHGAYIEITLFVEKETHKAIVIGQHGEMLKQIGTYARKEIEQVTGRKVFLRLQVKVRKNWRNDEKTLRSFGFKPS